VIVLVDEGDVNGGDTVVDEGHLDHTASDSLEVASSSVQPGDGGSEFTVDGVVAGVGEVVEVLGEDGLQRGINIFKFPGRIDEKGLRLTVPYPHLLTCWIRWDSALTETTPAKTAAAAAMDFKENIV
jgi:hypothetical protein